MNIFSAIFTLSALGFYSEVLTAQVGQNRELASIYSVQSMFASLYKNRTATKLLDKCDDETCYQNIDCLNPCCDASKKDLCILTAITCLPSLGPFNLACGLTKNSCLQEVVDLACKIDCQCTHGAKGGSCQVYPLKGGIETCKCEYTEDGKMENPLKCPLLIPDPLPGIQTLELCGTSIPLKVALCQADCGCFHNAKGICTAKVGDSKKYVCLCDYSS